jgi:hypothetical protein
VVQPGWPTSAAMSALGPSRATRVIVTAYRWYVYLGPGGPLIAASALPRGAEAAGGDSPRSFRKSGSAR